MRCTLQKETRLLFHSHSCVTPRQTGRQVGRLTVTQAFLTRCGMLLSLLLFLHHYFSTASTNGQKCTSEVPAFSKDSRVGTQPQLCPTWHTGMVTNHSHSGQSIPPVPAGPLGPHPMFPISAMHEARKEPSWPSRPSVCSFCRSACCHCQRIDVPFREAPRGAGKSQPPKANRHRMLKMLCAGSASPALDREPLGRSSSIFRASSFVEIKKEVECVRTT